MWDDIANYKKYAIHLVIVVFLALFIFGQNQPHVYACAESSQEEIEKEFESNINDILGDVDSSELDEFVAVDFDIEFLSSGSFKEIVLSVLNGNYYNDYIGLFDLIVTTFKDHFKSLLSIFIMFVAIALLHELFNNFCVDKYADIKKSVKIVFSVFVIMLLAYLVKDVALSASQIVEKLFRFSNILFPILLSLVSLSGAIGTYSVYSSLSVFLLNTCSYVFVYVLLPLAISILILSLVGSTFASKRFEKTISIFKLIFKVVTGLILGVFGLFSVINLVTAGVKDGVSLRLTKFAIKNYVPILGGYISDGFDFVHSCSVVIKNAFGLCGIIVLFFIVLKPLILCFSYILLFKLLSFFLAYITNGFYSDTFENVSKCLGCLVTVLVGVFLIIFVFIFLLIFSVSVVWCFIKFQYLSLF